MKDKNVYIEFKYRFEDLYLQSDDSQPSEEEVLSGRARLLKVYEIKNEIKLDKEYITKITKRLVEDNGDPGQEFLGNYIIKTTDSFRKSKGFLQRKNRISFGLPPDKYTRSVLFNLFIADLKKMEEIVNDKD